MTRHRDRATEPELQQTFDWKRATRQEWLEKIDIPRFQRIEADGTARNARTGAMKQLLLRIETYTRDGGEWTLHESTIARALGVSRRTVIRIVADCEALGLLIVKRAEGRASSYAIGWFAVKDILMSNPKTAAIVVMPTKTQTQESDAKPDTCDNLTETCDNLTETCDNLARQERQHTSIRAGAVFNQCFKPVESNPCAEPPQNFAYKGFAGWPFKIELPHLRNAESVQRLWEHAAGRGYVSDTDRVRFFALARHTAMRAQRKELANPGGYFHDCIVKRKWKGASLDEQAAVRIVALIDCRGSRPNKPRTNVVSDAAKRLAELFPNLGGIE
jgi:hypothetical protein